MLAPVSAARSRGESRDAREEPLHRPRPVVDEDDAVGASFVAAGGLLGAGSDPWGTGFMPGYGDLRNYELLIEAGFSPPEAVQIMTLNGARILGEQQRIGSIEPGKAADLVVIRGNLAANARAIRNVSMCSGTATASIPRSCGTRYGASSGLTEMKSARTTRRRLKIQTNIVRSAMLAIAGGIACVHLTDPPLPVDAEQFTPPPVYARWWSMVESCSGIKGSLDAIQWYAAPGPLVNPEDPDALINGYWSAASNRIVLDLNHTINGRVVRHGMLHALIRIQGHPRGAFLDRCGGIVSCGATCVRDAGDAPTPGSSVMRVNPSALEVTGEVSQLAAGAATGGSLATFTVSAHNPLPYPVVVLLPPRPGGDVRRSFTYDIRESSGEGVSSRDLALDPAITFFNPGETKRAVLDFLVLPTDSPPQTRVPGLGENGIALSPGIYTFRGDYGGNAGPDRSVTLEH